MDIFIDRILFVAIEHHKESPQIRILSDNFTNITGMPSL